MTDAKPGRRIISAPDFEDSAQPCVAPSQLWQSTLIVEALARLRSRSCIIDGEAVARGDDGIPTFDRIRYRRHDASVFLYAFDLIALNGATCAEIRFRCARPHSRLSWTRLTPGIRVNEHIEGDGPTVFRHACKLGLEGIVSKRKDSTYRPTEPERTGGEAGSGGGPG